MVEWALRLGFGTLDQEQTGKEMGARPLGAEGAEVDLAARTVEIEE
jgi:hypothetical protein